PLRGAPVRRRRRAVSRLRRGGRRSRDGFAPVERARANSFAQKASKNPRSRSPEGGAPRRGPEEAALPFSGRSRASTGGGAPDGRERAPTGGGLAPGSSYASNDGTADPSETSGRFATRAAGGATARSSARSSGRTGRRTSRALDLRV